MNKKIIQYFATTTAIILLSLYFFIKTPDKNNQEEDTYQIAEQGLSKETTRKPASLSKKINEVPIYQPAIKRAKLDKTQFNEPPSQGIHEEENARYGSGSKVENRNPYESIAYSPELPNTGPMMPDEITSSLIGGDPLLNNKKNEIEGVGGGVYKKASSPTAAASDKKTTILSSSVAGGTTIASNTCSSNVAGGTFNTSVGVTLSCTAVSTIKYCLELDTGSGCCDPEATGVTYNSSITVGPISGNYCLSYYGEATTPGNSIVYEQNYIINTSLPNLMVAHPLQYYQTTQLADRTLVTSSDFGKAGYNIGQINLKTHDPGPAAENLDCDNIVNNHTSLVTPGPVEVLLGLDVSSDSPTVQIEIPMIVSNLDYGDNFVTTYIENTNKMTPMYSCSTSKIVLNDFEYFQENPAFGDAGTNTVREFTGGLSPYGFFEDAAQISRDPAGEQTQTKAGQKLQYGMFGMFY